MSFWKQAGRIANGVQILTDWWGEGALPVDNEVAQKRADVCLTCPKNQDGAVLVESVAKAIKQQVGIKNALQLRLNGEKKLKSCMVCSCWLPLKLWLPLDKLKSEASVEEIAAYPDFCFMKTEQP